MNRVYRLLKRHDKLSEKEANNVSGSCCKSLEEGCHQILPQFTQCYFDSHFEGPIEYQYAFVLKGFEDTIRFLQKEEQNEGASISSNNAHLLPSQGTLKDVCKLFETCWLFRSHQNVQFHGTVEFFYRKYMS